MAPKRQKKVVVKKKIKKVVEETRHIEDVDEEENGQENGQETENIVFSDEEENREETENIVFSDEEENREETCPTELVEVTVEDGQGDRESIEVVHSPSEGKAREKAKKKGKTKMVETQTPEETQEDTRESENGGEPKTPKKSEARNQKKYAERRPQMSKRKGKKRNAAGDMGMGGVGGYKTYLYRVLKQVHPSLGVSSRAMQVMDMMMADMFERVADEAARLNKYTGKLTITAREIHDAVKLVLPGELGMHAISEGNNAVLRYYRNAK